ncbi:MAG: aldehyde ferredoxin oxidoreductase family protein [Deltaproteobacteria bacterium]|nr:aldehyde ferredoxin oxidoreductase family protein [Deltaproteobacteria bacterium]
MYGFHNRLAWIDLSERTVEVRALEEADVEAFAGGSGLGAALLARLTGPGTAPLAPENPLLFLTGPFTATVVPAGSRHEVVSLSPLTGVYGESNCGGSLGWHLKRAGFDGLVITGAADAPVTVAVDRGEVRVQEAVDLWGKDVYAADAALKGALADRGAATAIIGPAGERQILLASVSHDGRHTRAAGRCGLGAVMGSKRLKAVVVTSHGEAATPVADPEGLRGSVQAGVAVIRDRLDVFGEFGTPGGVLVYEKLGNLPIRNWREGRAPELASRISGQTMKDTIRVRRTGCRACPIHCGRLVEVREGPFATDGIVSGPEYETLAAFGSLCGNWDLASIAKANELCNTLGVDTISVGAVVAFACECFEKGLLGPSDADGLELAFGASEAIVELTRRIAVGEGELARTLGEGVRRAARKIGGTAAEYALEVKGLEFPMHDPRFSWGQALSYATSNRGACHLAGLTHPFEIAVSLPELGYETPFPPRERRGKAEWTIHLQNLMSLVDSLSVCKFTMLNNALRVSNFLDWYNLITGRDVDLGAFLAMGDRAFTLKRMVNNGRGIGRKDDLLPPRMRTLRKRGEGLDFDVPPGDQLLSDYYELRGWTEEGRPGQVTVERLGLGPWAGRVLA